VLGSEPAETLFVVSHLSDVVGHRLVDQREVVVKRRFDEFRRAPTCVIAQRLLADRGFTCPMPLTDVLFDAGYALHAEQLVDGGRIETDDGPAAASRSAVLFADHLRRLEGLSLDPPLPNPEWVSWGAPPARRKAADVPSWIEDTSRRILKKLVGCRLPSVLGHADWEAQNMRWLHDEPLAVHDWDSLAWLPEAALVGTASGVFATQDSPTLAPIESSAVFIDAYETARGNAFSSYEREIVWAASVWVALHNARDELIFDRPGLSYEGLQAQHAERLALAKA
jgi:hypothetical protein